MVLLTTNRPMAAEKLDAPNLEQQYTNAYFRQDLSLLSFVFLFFKNISIKYLEEDFHKISC